MYQVTKTTHIAGQPIRIDWSYEFLTEKEAVDCMVRHANANDLEINDHYTEAYSEGNKPETLIIVNQI